MSDNEVVGRIRIELTGNEQVANKIKATRQEVEKLNASVIDNRGKSAVEGLGEEFAKMDSKIRSVAQRGKDLREVLGAVGATKDEIAEQVAIFDKMTSAVKKTEQSVGALNDRIAQAKKIQQTAGGYDDIRNELLDPEDGGSGRSMSKAERREMLRLSVNNARFAASDIARGDYTGAIVNATQAASGFNALGVTLGNLIAIGGPLVIAFGVLVAVLKQTEDAAKKAAEAQKENYDDAIKRTEIANRNITDARSKTLEQNEQDAADLVVEIENYGKLLADLRDKRAATDKAYADLGAALDPAKRASLGAVGQELDKEIQSVRDTLDGLNLEYQNSTQVLPDLIKSHQDEIAAIEAETKARQDAINAVLTQGNQQLRVDKEIAALGGQSSQQLEARRAALQRDIEIQDAYIKTLESTGEPSEQLDAQITSAYLEMQVMTSVLKYLETGVIGTTKASEEYAAQLKEAEKAADEFAANSRKIADVEKSRSKQLEDRARTDSRNAQVSALESQIAAAKELEAQEQKSQKIVSLRKKAGEDEADAVRKYGDDLRKANADYMAESLKALASFQLEQSRSEEDYARERIRKLQDLQSSLSELAAKGDVSSFISTQRSGVRDLQRGDEDFGVESRRRLEDFRLENEERIRQRDERLRELQNEFATERAARQANLQEQIAQEQEQGKQRILRSGELEKQLSALREQFAIEDVARQRAVEDAAFAEQMKVLRDRQKVIGDQITKFADPVITAGKKLFDDTSKAIVDAYARIRAAASGRTSIGGSAKMHDVGALYTQPTTLLSSFAEKPGRGDFVLPFNTNEGWRPMMERLLAQGGGGSSGGGSVVVNITTGDVATASQVESVKQGVIEAVRMARQGI